MSGRLDVLRERAPSLAVAWTTAAGLALVAPLEHAAGVALGLGEWHAWTITAAVEGATAAALLAGRYVPAALTLTGTSVLVGALQMRSARTGRDPWDDRAGVALAVAVTLLGVAAMLLVHRVRAGVLAERMAAAAKRTADDQSRRDKEAARIERAETMAHGRRLVEAQQAEQARTAEHERRMAADRQRAFAEQETARLALEAERERTRREHEQAVTEQARADAERQRADAERIHADREQRRAADEQVRARAEQARRDAEQRQAAADHARAEYEQRLRDDREFAREQWIDHQWTDKDLAPLLGISEGRARALIADWRKPHAVRGAEA